jgi:hypothetical protein
MFDATQPGTGGGGKPAAGTLSLAKIQQPERGKLLDVNSSGHEIVRLEFVLYPQKWIISKVFVLDHRNPKATEYSLTAAYRAIMFANGKTMESHPEAFRISDRKVFARNLLDAGKCAIKTGLSSNLDSKGEPFVEIERFLSPAQEHRTVDDWFKLNPVADEAPAVTQAPDPYDNGLGMEDYESDRAQDNNSSDEIKF